MRYILAGMLFFMTGVHGQPVINSFSPSSGPIGTPVTISGSNFSPVAGDNIVYFGAVRAVVSNTNATTLTVTVPAGATYQPISVTNNKLTAYSSQPFVVTFAGGGTITATSLGSRADFSTGSNVYYLPYSVSVSDLNDDGKPDLVSAIGPNDLLSILRNITTTGPISFAGPMEFAITGTPYHVAIGDLDGDGKPDLVTANLNANSVSVLKNTSSGGNISFAARTDLITGNNPTHLSIDDLDGDGKPELIVANSGSNSVSIFKNSATGGTISFAAKNDFATGSIPLKVSSVDLDGDNKPDLAIANSGTNTVSILKNTSIGGNISFLAKTEFTAGNGPYSVSAGDIDGDNKPDLAVANYGSATLEENKVSVLRNTSTGGNISFASRVEFIVGYNPRTVAINDVDGDGKPDLAIPDNTDNKISVLKNISVPGTISFASTVNYPTRSRPNDIAAGDLDGDGKPELVVADEAVVISVFRNKANEPTITSFTPGFAPPGSTIAINGTNLTGTTAVSIGGVAATSVNVVSATTVTAVVGAGATVGIVTVTTPYGTASYSGFSIFGPPVVSSFAPASGPTGTVVNINGSNFNVTPAQNIVYFGSVKATVSAATATSLTVTVPPGSDYKYISVTDLATGLTAYSAKPFVVTFVSNGNPAFAPGVDFSTGPINDFIAVGDVDGDGKPDLAISNDLTGLGNYAITILRNTSLPGGVSFVNSVNLAFAQYVSPSGVIIGDVDGDGKADIVAGIDHDTVSVFRNTSSSGNISFANKINFPVSIGRPRTISINDFDSDGKPDLAISYSSSTNQSIVSVLRNTSPPGTINFSSAQDYLTGSNPFSHAIGDVDGDGKADLVVANEFVNTLSVLRNTSVPGVISFGPKVDLATGQSPYDISMGDLDGDGKPDLVATSNFYDNILLGWTVSVFRNISSTGTISFGAKQSFVTGQSPIHLVIGDTDGDGKPDLATAGAWDTIHVLRNTSSAGNISFAAKKTFATSPGALLSLDMGDVDGDGKPDLISLNHGTTDIVSVKRNTSSSTATAVSNLAADEFILLRPNPVTDDFIITYKINGLQNLDIKLIDNAGRILKTQNKYKSNQKINIKGLPPGSYFILLQSQDGKRRYLKQIIKLSQ